MRRVSRLFCGQNMAAPITTLTNAIASLNALYEGDSTPPAAGEEDFIVWTALLNLAVNLWENEEGVLWKQLFVKLADAADGDKTTTAGDYSYSTPSNFVFPASGYVWLGSGTAKTPYKIIPQSDLQLYENSTGNWCYFLMDTTPTLEFNPNCTLNTGDTISYNYYKDATGFTAASTGAETFDMSDPGFAVYYALSELKKEEGDTSALSIATQKLEAMKTKNVMPADWEELSIRPKTSRGFGR